MPDKRITQLTDGISTQTSAARIETEQDGASFFTTTMPNPPNQINVSSQDQLEAELGTDIEIPNGEFQTIVYDDDFTLDKPFKVGNGSGFELRAATVGLQINYTGPGGTIQKINPADEAFFIFLENLDVRGDNTNSFIDAKVSAFGFSVFTGVNVANFARIGEFIVPSLFIDRFTGFNITQGLVVRDSVRVRLDNLSFANFFTTNTTWFTFLGSTTPVISLRDTDVSNVTSGDSLVFLDPNAVSGTSFIINGSRIVGGGDFYQQGVDNNISVVVDNGPNALFVTADPHGMVVGTPVVISGFVTNTDYNGTKIVTSAPAANTFETGVAFGSSEAVGKINKASLDQTDILVCAQNNSDSPNSKSIGGWSHTSNVASTTIVDGTFGPLNLSTAGGVTPFVENERFIVFDANDGTLQYIGVQSITVSLLGILSISKGGSTNDYNLRYAVDHEEIDTVAVVDGGTGYTGGDIVTLTGQTSGATNATAFVSVTAGVITAINITFGGFGYDDGETVDVIGGTGSGATGTVTTFGFIALPTVIERSQSISSTSRDSSLNQKVVLDTGHKIRIEIEGVGTTDDIEVTFGSLDIT